MMLELNMIPNNRNCHSSATTLGTYEKKLEVWNTNSPRNLIQRNFRKLLVRIEMAQISSPVRKAVQPPTK
jgi:hypothetical protein